MLYRSITLGLLLLLIWHTMAFVLVSAVTWWQAETDLSAQLVVYRSVDSLVEFEVPIDPAADRGQVGSTTPDGFRYQGHFYTVIRLEVQGDRLLITSLELPRPAFWQDDLLAFLNHLGASSDTGHKANQLLKFLLKEYAPNPRLALHFSRCPWCQRLRIADGLSAYCTRALAVQSPPPKGAA